MISFCSSTWVISEISLETSWLMLLGRPSIQTCHPPPTTSQCLDQPMSKKRWDTNPPNWLWYLLYCIQSRAGWLKSIFLQTKNVQNWILDPGWWWAHKRRLELFAQVSEIHHKVLILESEITKYCMYCLFWLTMQILSIVIEFCANTSVYFVVLGSGLSICKKKWKNYWYIEAPDIDVGLYVKMFQLLQIKHEWIPKKFWKWLTHIIWSEKIPGPCENKSVDCRFHKHSW